MVSSYSLQAPRDFTKTNSETLVESILEALFAGVTLNPKPQTLTPNPYTLNPNHGYYQGMELKSRNLSVLSSDRGQCVGVCCLSLS